MGSVLINKIFMIKKIRSKYLLMTSPSNQYLIILGRNVSSDLFNIHEVVKIINN